MTRNCRDCARYNSEIKGGCRIWVFSQRYSGDCEYFAIISSEQWWILFSIIGLVLFIVLLESVSLAIALAGIPIYASMVGFCLKQYNSCKICGNVGFIKEKDLANHIKDNHMRYR